MRLLVLALLAAAACAPAAPVTAAATPVAVTATPTIGPPTPSPTPVPATARPTPVPTVAGPVHNEGQVIVADLAVGRSTFVGEAGPAPAVTTGTHWRVNGTVLAGADIKCTRRSTAQPQSDLCVGVRMITDKVRLRNGASYEVVLDDEVIGSFVASGLAVATPHVVSLKATQFALTIQFDRPMLHAGDCGSGPLWSFTTPGTIEHVRGIANAFPAPLASYTSTSAAYRAFLAAFVSEAQLSVDCTTVTLGSGWGGPTGMFDVTVAGVQDVDGNVVQPRTFTVDVLDEGAPKLMFAQLELQTAQKKVIRVAYSEAMDEAYVTDAERYYLNGAPIPAGTTLECELAGCTWVRLTFAPSAFGYGSENTLTIIGVRDMAGNAMSPDIVTSGKFPVY